jgi:endonuclease-3
MTKKERYKLVIEYFTKHMPVAETELVYRTPYELLVSVILSAQCTDKRVNVITQELFRTFPTENELARAEVEEIFACIFTPEENCSGDVCCVY